MILVVVETRRTVVSMLCGVESVSDVSLGLYRHSYWVFLFENWWYNMSQRRPHIKISRSYEPGPLVTITYIICSCPTTRVHRSFFSRIVCFNSSNSSTSHCKEKRETSHHTDTKNARFTSKHRLTVALLNLPLRKSTRSPWVANHKQYPAESSGLSVSVANVLAGMESRARVVIMAPTSNDIHIGE